MQTGGEATLMREQNAETKTVYNSRLLKGGALIPEMRTLVRLWQDDVPFQDLRNRVERENILGKASRARVRDVLSRTFLPRYAHGNPPNAWRYLRPFEDAHAPLHVVRPLYYLYAARSEAILGDFVRNYLYERYRAGLLAVSMEDALHFVHQAEADGRIPEPWSESVSVKVARGMLAALRDFGILTGRARKRIAPPYLDVIPFAHAAFLLAGERHGAAALEHPDWRLFLMDRDAVERLFVEADRAGLLRYNAAGSIVRIDFPEEDLYAYSRFLAERATEATGS